jgi:hypothetical protein
MKPIVQLSSNKIQNLWFGDLIFLTYNLNLFKS